jgi:hypothetical protein
MIQKRMHKSSVERRQIIFALPGQRYIQSTRFGYFYTYTACPKLIRIEYLIPLDNKKDDVFLTGYLYIE